MHVCGWATFSMFVVSSPAPGASLPTNALYPPPCPWRVPPHQRVVSPSLPLARPSPPTPRSNKLTGQLPRHVPAWLNRQEALQVSLGHNQLTGSLWPEWSKVNPAFFSVR
jgi:hypothetical protein